jgi:aspartate aminotransferase
VSPDESKRVSDAIRARILEIGASKIRQIANAGFGRPGILPFWFGESDQPTPDFIVREAVRSLTAGDTFYTHNQGMAELRAEIAAYVTRLHGVPVSTDGIAVTSSGVSALMLVMQTLLDPGDDVVVVAPVWPNLFEIPRILSAHVRFFSLAVREGRWRLDVDRLIAALHSDTRLLVINSPSNPTGWQIEPSEQQRLLAHCRRHGIWILADEVYERLTFDTGRKAAPSFLAAATAEDRLIVVNSFSKAWYMTGWRLGWLIAAPPVVREVAKLTEYNTSCAPGFVQAAGIVALRDGEAGVAEARRRLLANRDSLVSDLRRIPSLEVPEPAGGMYVYFRVAGERESMTLAQQLIEKVGLGLAPGAAFAPDDEGWLRWCFAAQKEKLAEGVKRLERFVR